MRNARLLLVAGGIMSLHGALSGAGHRCRSPVTCLADHNQLRTEAVRVHCGCRIRHVMLAWLLLWLCISSAAPAPAQARSAPAVAAEAAAGGPSDPREVRAFIDQLINEQLTTQHIAGAMVVVVRGSQVLLAQGYGYADIAAGRPFDAGTTLLPIGSTSKLFTWTAVMQLAEQGRLDLDADVNTYLEGFSIPDTYPEPVTLRDLMSHSAGFEDLNMGMMTVAPEEIIPLKNYLMRYMPERVRPPGQLTAYSNYGAALAGYIVEVVSGVPFEQYVEENIFGPLGMTRSSFRQPLPSELAQDLARGYSYDEGFVPQPLIYVSMRPAGSMSTTAEDIARFMIAHLQDGRYENAHILREDTSRQMHSRLFANDPRLSGFAYGFMDQRINGQRVLHHGGGLPPYFGVLALLPESQVGFYVGYNGLGDSPAVPEFRDGFFEHYYPRPRAVAPVASRSSTRPELLIGMYHTTRSNSTSLERIVELAGMGYGRVTAGPDGTLDVSVNMGVSPTQARFVEIEPMLFISTDGREKLAFGTDADGNIQRMFLDSHPECAYEKISWYEQPGLHAAALIACLTIFALTILAGLLGWLRRRKAAASLPNPESERLRRAGLALSAVSLLTMGSLLALMAVGGLISEPPVWIPAVFALAWLSALLSAIVAALAVRAWIRGFGQRSVRLHVSLLAVAAAVFTIWMGYWNLLRLGL